MNTYLSYITCTIYIYIQSNIGIIIDTNGYKIHLNNEAVALFTYRFFTKTLSATFIHFFKPNNYFHDHDAWSSSKINT